MQSVYKETMRNIINKQARILYRNLELSPGFSIEDTVGRLGGEISKVDKLDNNTDAKISPTEDGMNFVIRHTIPEHNEKYLRFSVAHELGHLFLHMAQPDEKKGYVIEGSYAHNGKSDSIIEWEAEEFAAAFLMPEDVFVHESEIIDEDNNNDGKDKIELLSDKFKVPYKSVIVRGRNLEIW